MAKQQIGRLKARQEGDWWVFRYELEPGVEMELGRVHMRTVARPERKQAALELFCRMAEDVIETVTGVRPVFGGPVIAPAHERAGRG